MWLYNNRFIPIQNKNIHNNLELPDRMTRFRFFFGESKLSIRLNEGHCQSLMQQRRLFSPCTVAVCYI